MEWAIFLILFLMGVQAQAPNRTFHLIQPGKSWSDALSYCRTFYTDLAIIRNVEDLALIQAEAEAWMFMSEAWIGLSVDLNSWRWSLGRLPVSAAGASYWASSFGEPNNYNGHEECAGMGQGGWLDLNCLSLYPFVCFDERNVGSARYILYPNPLSWLDAQSYCRQHHTDLASTRDQAEYSTVYALSSRNFWIGLSRDSWRWVNHVPLSVDWWYPGQPNGGKENCSSLFAATAIADWTCEHVVPFFCHHGPVIGQVRHLRFGVRSGQDMNNPAELEALVQKIKEKLKDHSLEKDISVEWRQQPDGNIFRVTN